MAQQPTPYNGYNYGYPPSQPGYPPQQPNGYYGMPQQQPGYPTQQPGYNVPPTQQPGYPPQQPVSYGMPPQQQPGYPPQSGYGMQQQTAPGYGYGQPNYPPQQQQPGYNGYGYPPQQQQGYGYPAPVPMPGQPMPMPGQPMAMPGSSPDPAPTQQKGTSGAPGAPAQRQLPPQAPLVTDICSYAWDAEQKCWEDGPSSGSRPKQNMEDSPTPTKFVMTAGTGYGNGDYDVCVYDIPSKACIYRIKNKAMPDADITGDLLVGCGWENSSAKVWVYSINQRKELASYSGVNEDSFHGVITLKNGSGTPICVCAPTVGAEQPDKLRLFDLATCKRAGKIADVYESQFPYMQRDPHNVGCFFVSSYRKMYMYDVRTGTRARMFPIKTDGQFRVPYSNPGKFVACDEETKSVKVIDIGTGNAIHNITTRANTNFPYASCAMYSNVVACVGQQVYPAMRSVLDIFDINGAAAEISSSTHDLVSRYQESLVDMPSSNKIIVSGDNFMKIFTASKSP